MSVWEGVLIIRIEAVVETAYAPGIAYARRWYARRCAFVGNAKTERTTKQWYGSAATTNPVSRTSAIRRGGKRLQNGMRRLVALEENAALKMQAQTLGIHATRNIMGNVTATRAVTPSLGYGVVVPGKKRAAAAWRTEWQVTGRVKACMPPALLAVGCLKRTPNRASASGKVVGRCTCVNEWR